MKKRVNKIVWMFMLVLSLTQAYPTLSSANTSISWSEVQSGSYDSLLDNQLMPKTEIMLQIENKAALVNGKAQSMEVAPTLMNETTMVPLRFIAEALGATVSWNAEESKITINMGKDIVELWVGKIQSKVNGQSRDMVVPALIILGNTLVPVRFVSENLNQDVSYNPDSQTINISGSIFE
jgi:hypothetical protein